MALRPAVQPFSRRRSVLDFFLENSPPFVDQEVADVRVSGVTWISEFRECENLARYFFLRLLDPFCDVLDDVAVVIPGPECH